MNESTDAPRSNRRRRILTIAVTTLLAGSGLLAWGLESAQAGPYGNCDDAKYTGAHFGNGGTATVHCYALGDISARIKLTCFIGPVPSATKNTPWVNIRAGKNKVLTYKSTGWCESFGQTWRADGQIK